jgi:hypothetical protein
MNTRGVSFESLMLMNRMNLFLGGDVSVTGRTLPITASREFNRGLHN